MQGESRGQKRFLWQRAFLAILCLISALCLALYQTAFSLKLNQATSYAQRGEVQAQKTRASTVSNSFNEVKRLSTNITSDRLVTKREYRRLDEAAPSIRYATTHFLRSIPSSRRLSIEAGLNETVLYSDPWIQKRRYLFEFNPSIVKLPDHQRTLPNAVYLACYRVSTQHACFHQERNEIRHTNYIGFAVLDSQLQVLQETTVNPYSALKRYEDFRLFVLKNDLYVASFFGLHRFWIVPPGQQQNKVVELEGLTPSNLTVTVQRSRLCTRDPSVRRTAKSLVYFEDKDGTLLMESFPMERKEVIPDVSCDYHNASLLPNFIPLNKTLPAPTFNTTDDLYFQQPNMRRPGITGDRGSYCCATIEHKGRAYWLGVSHLKTRTFHTPAPNNPAPNQYFSRFYAMEMTYPYNVIARSGKFCLGVNASEHVWYYSNLTSSRRLQLGDDIMKCPGIHFISGLTDSQDPTQLIIGYGINDCFARFVVVDKEDVAYMLWS